MNNALPKSEKELKYETKGNKEYKVEAIIAIIDSVVYGQ